MLGNDKTKVDLKIKKETNQILSQFKGQLAFDLNEKKKA